MREYAQRHNFGVRGRIESFCLLCFRVLFVSACVYVSVFVRERAGTIKIRRKKNEMHVTCSNVGSAQPPLRRPFLPLRRITSTFPRALSCHREMWIYKNQPVTLPRTVSSLLTDEPKCCALFAPFSKPIQSGEFRFLR